MMGNQEFRPEQAGTRVIKDLAYTAPQPQTSQGYMLDLYLPEDGRGPAPLVIWIHGSGLAGRER